MARTDKIRANNAQKRADAIRRVTTALTQPTLDQAAEYYGTTQDTFIKATHRYGLYDQLINQYTGGLTIREYHEEQKVTAFIEDAEWLARTGENTEGATKRLGFTNSDGLFARLDRYGRNDIFAALQANSDNGHLRAGTIHGPTHGSRM